MRIGSQEPRGEKFPQEIMNEIRERADLQTLIGKTVSLRRAGRDMVGLCPFHQEHTPSFHVSQGRGWSCFGCGEKGTAIEWVMKTRGVSFPDAVRVLAADLGIPLPGGAGGGRAPDPTPERRAMRRRTTEGTEGTAVEVVGIRAPSAPPSEPEEETGGAPSPFRWDPELTNRCAEALQSPDGAAVLAYLTSPRSGLPGARGLSETALTTFRLGALLIRDGSGTIVEQWATIPVMDALGTPTAMRFRAVPGPCLRCSGKGCSRCENGRVKKSFRNCPGRPLPLFNAHRMTKNKADSVIVVEGEFDVIALWDYGFRANVVSGTKGAGTWDEAWLDALEPYAAFYLAYDNDEAGDKGAEALAAKLGRERCLRARLPRKDAGDCLAEGLPVSEVEAALDRAEDLAPIRIQHIADLADEIEQDLATPAKLVGVPTGSSQLDACIGGDRPGLTVVTGDTGSGKTTFTTWQAVQRARMGVPVLLSAFEQGYKKVAQKVLRQFVGGDFTQVDRATRDAAWAEIRKLPIQIIRHHGRMSYADVVATIRRSVRRSGVKWIQLDHLGYITDPAAKDPVRDIEMIVQGLALLSVQPDIEVCLWLVAHPNSAPGSQGRRVTVHDLKGSSAIKQEASVVLSVQAMPIALRGHPSTNIYAEKVRDEFGIQGSSCSLAFDPNATVYADEWGMTPLGAVGGNVHSPEADEGEARPVTGRRRGT